MADDKYTIADFSGNIFGQDKEVNVCNMKCEMSLNETDIVNIEKFNGSFKIYSNLFTVKYGNLIYSLNNSTNYVSNEIIHKGIFDTTYGVVRELIFKTKSTNGSKKLYIHIPIYQGFKSNENGILLENISSSQGRKELNISDLFPKNISFYTYSANNETSVVFTTSNIMIKNIENVTNIVSSSSVQAGSILDTTVDAKRAGYKYFLNKKGIGEGVNETTIIDCQPIDDSGMLLEDREKGLNQTGISQTSNLEVIGNKLMENPLAQTAIGIILLYILTRLLKTGQTLFPKLNAN